MRTARIYTSGKLNNLWRNGWCNTEKLTHQVSGLCSLFRPTGQCPQLTSFYSVFQKRENIHSLYVQHPGQCSYRFHSIFNWIVKQTSLSNSHTQILFKENWAGSWAEETTVRGAHMDTGEQTGTEASIYHDWFNTQASTEGMSSVCEHARRSLVCV